HVATSYFAGTRRFSSSNQFWTIMMRGVSAAVLPAGFIITNRRPSGATSKARPAAPPNVRPLLPGLYMKAPARIRTGVVLLHDVDVDDSTCTPISTSSGAT